MPSENTALPQTRVHVLWVAADARKHLLQRSQPGVVADRRTRLLACGHHVRAIAKWFAMFREAPQNPFPTGPLHGLRNEPRTEEPSARTGCEKNRAQEQAVSRQRSRQNIEPMANRSLLLIVVLTLGACDGARVQRPPLATIQASSRSGGRGATRGERAGPSQPLCETSGGRLPDEPECRHPDEYRGDQHSSADAIGAMCAGGCAAFHT